MLCKLNCKGSDTTGARVDENFLPLLEVRSFDQHLPSGQADQRNGSGFGHGEGFWLYRHIIFIHRDEFGERTDAV